MQLGDSPIPMITSISFMLELSSPGWVNDCFVAQNSRLIPSDRYGIGKPLSKRRSESFAPAASLSLLRAGSPPSSRDYRNRRAGSSHQDLPGLLTMQRCKSSSVRNVSSPDLCQGFREPGLRRSVRNPHYQEHLLDERQGTRREAGGRFLPRMGVVGWYVCFSEHDTCGSHVLSQSHICTTLGNSTLH